MSNEIASTLPVVSRAWLLAACIVSTGACDAATSTGEGGSAASPARYQQDAARHRVWALTPNGVSVHDITAPDGVDIALPGWQWVDAPYACRPELALGPDGAALITSNVVPTLWRIDPVTLTVSVHPLALDADTHKDVGFSALVYSPRHAMFFAASDVHGSLWKIDPQLKTAHKMRLAARLPGGCTLALDAPSDQVGGATDALCLGDAGPSWAIRIAHDQRSAQVQYASCRPDHRARASRAAAR